MLSISDFDGDGHRWIMASAGNKCLYGRISYKYGKCSYEVERDGHLAFRSYSLQEAIDEFNR